MIKKYEIPKPKNAERATKVIEVIQGEKGDKGDNGKDGWDGKNGIDGAKGDQGIQGEKGKDGRDGKNGLNGQDGSDGKDGKNGSLDTAEQVRDKLENLPKGKKLSIQAIEDLAKMLEDLSKKGSETKDGIGLLKGSIHGGKSKEIRFVDDETPVNSGDDTNFTISKTPITGSLKFYRNGSRQVLTTDYSLVGKIITLVVPLQDPSEKLLVDYRY